MNLIISVCLSVYTAKLIWFIFTVKLLMGPGKFFWGAIIREMKLVKVADSDYDVKKLTNERPL